MIVTIEIVQATTEVNRPMPKKNMMKPIANAGSQANASGLSVIQLFGHAAIATKTEMVPQTRRHEPNAFGKWVRFGDWVDSVTDGGGSYGLSFNAEAFSVE